MRERINHVRLGRVGVRSLGGGRGRAAVSAAVESLEGRRLLSFGTLDPSFGQDGVAVANFQSQAYDTAARVVVQADGKFVVGGTTRNGTASHIGLARFNPDGTPDGSFGTNGTVDIWFDGTGQGDLYDMDLAPDGKILVVGPTVGGAPGIARLNPDGSRDTTFGGDGDVVTTFRADFVYPSAGIAVQSDGRVVVGGVFEGFDGYAYNQGGFAVGRLNADGSPDDGSAADSTPGDVFGTDGIAVTPPFSLYYQMSTDMAVDGNDRIVLGGWADVNDTTGFGVVRYTASGARDVTFGDGMGAVATTFPDGGVGEHFQQATPAALALSPGGKIVLAGTVFRYLTEETTNEFGVVRFDDNGHADPTFGNGGFATCNVADKDFVRDVAVDASGTVTVAGQSHLLRFRANGSADAAFGQSGVVSVPDVYEDPERPRGSVALLPGGAFLVAGFVRPTALGDVAVTRYGPTGAVDTAFGQNGTASAGFTGSRWDFGRTVMVRPDGRMLVAGNSDGYLGRRVALAQYLPDGSPDGSFGEGGKALVQTPLGFDSWAFAFDASGGVLLGGNVPDASQTGSVFAVFRIKPDGSPDTGFGQGGRAVADVRPGGAGSAVVSALAVDAAGRIVAVGNVSTSMVDPDTNMQWSESKFAVARFSASGTLDTAFGAGGAAVTDVPGSGEYADSVAIAPGGNIVVGGMTGSYLFGEDRDMAVVRYLPNGTLDPSFGDGGVARVNYYEDEYATRSGDYLYDVAVQPDGKIIAVGATDYTTAGGTSVQDAAVVRLNVDGSHDFSFGAWSGAGGFVTLDVGFVRADGSGTGYEDAAAVTVQPDGMIVVAGATFGGEFGRDIFLARYAADGRLDPHFGRHGVVLTSVGPAGVHSDDTASDVALDAQGRFLVAGTHLLDPIVDAGSDFLLLRYRNTNEADTSAPEAGPVTVSTPEDTPVAITLAGSDADGDPLTYSVTEPQHGRLTKTAEGVYAYAPEANFYGTDSFSYTVRDGTGLDANSVTVTVTPVNDAPVGGADRYTASQDAELVIPAALGVLINDTDVDGDPLTATRPVPTDGPYSGTLRMNADGGFSYTPDPGYYGSDVFAYVADDGHGGTFVAYVQIDTAPSAAGAITLRPDGDVVVNGSDSNDVITVRPATRRAGYLTVSVTTNRVTTNTDVPAPAVGRSVYVYGYGGNDTLGVDRSVASSTRLYGDGGNDSLALGGGGGIAFGGDGADALDGGGARDILVGGPGADRITGDAGDDILIAGMTTADDRLGRSAHAATFGAALASWSRPGVTFADRVRSLASVFNDNTVIDDGAADVVDSLNGGAGNDWFIYSQRDKVVGMTPGERDVDLLVS